MRTVESGRREAVVGLPRDGPAGLRLSRSRNVSLPTVLLAGATVASGVLLVVLQSHLTFFIDDWDLLLHRRGFSAHVLLDPHEGHIILAPTIVYKAIQVTFGMGSIVPFAVASTAAFLASTSLLFVYLRPRIGEWLALAAVVPILFMGTAYEDLLTPFQICFFGSMACGIGALLALERRDRWGDRAACVLLVISLTFSEVGLPFIAGAAVAIGLDRGPLRRAYLIAVPILLYGLWYLGWGHTATNQVSFDNLATSPSYILDGLASSISSLLGLAASHELVSNGALDWGRPLLIGLFVLAALRLRALGRVPRWLWVVAAITVVFWFLTGLNASRARPPTASRYQYVGAVFALLIAAELARGVRPRWPTLVAVFTIAGAASLSNLSSLHSAYTGLHGEATTVRGGLGGLEVAANTVSPGFLLTQDNSDFNYYTLVDAGSYLSAADKFGSPGYTPAELPSAPEPARVAADKVMASALPVSFEPVSHAPSPAGPAPRLVGPPDARAGQRGSCLTVRPMRGAPSVLSLPPGGAILHASPGITARISLRRYASESFPIAAGTLRGAAVLEVPEDRASEPWELELEAAGAVSVCGSNAA